MLQVKDLVVAYGQSQALHGLSFETRENECVAIMGRNGMGKTTLFKSLVLARLERNAVQRLALAIGDDEVLDFQHGGSFNGRGRRRSLSDRLELDPWDLRPGSFPGASR